MSRRRPDFYSEAGMRDSPTVLENANKQGGLGLPNIAVKAECLFLKQTTRILSKPDETLEKINVN